MKQCPNCSNKCADTSRVCVYCGHAFAESTETQTADSRKISGADGAVKEPDVHTQSRTAERYERAPERIHTAAATATLERPQNVGTIHTATAEMKRTPPQSEEPQRTFAPSAKRIPSYFDSVAGSQMTEEEARRLLFGSTESTAAGDDFGSASPILDDKSVLKRNVSRAPLILGAVFRILFTVFGCLALLMFSSQMAQIQDFIVGDFIISPMILPIFFAILAIAPMITSVGLIAAFFIAKTHDGGYESALAGSFTAVRIGEFIRTAMFGIILVAADVLIAMSVDFANSDAWVYTCILSLNLLLIVGIVYCLICAGMFGNFIRVTDGSESLEPPIYAVDIVNIIMLFLLIPLGAFSIFRYSVVDTYSLGNSFIALVIATYISGCLALFFKSLAISVLRSDINTMDTVAASVEERGSGRYGF